jgi:hypothetical protein
VCLMLPGYGIEAEQGGNPGDDALQKTVKEISLLGQPKIPMQARRLSESLRDGAS